MKLLSLRLPVASFFILGGLIAAQAADKVAKPLPSQPSVKATRESTATVVPQINEFRPPGTRQHENEFEESYRDWWKPGTPNNLPLGGHNNLDRVQSRTISPSGSSRWPAVGATGWIPPDPALAVSRTHVVVTVNSSIAFFTRSGTKQFQQVIDGAGGFFGSVNPTNFVFDPKCFFDKATGRFFVVALDLDEGAKVSNFLIAVSDDGDPNGNWFKYKVSNVLTVGTKEYWLDYPGWGFNKDFVVASGNMFPLPGTNDFGGVQTFAFNKAALVAGNTGTIVKFLSDTFTMQWAKSTETTSNAAYGVAVGSGSAMELWALRGTGTNLTLVGRNVSVPNWSRPTRSAASTGGHFLDPSDGRILTTGFRTGGRLVATHSVNSGQSDNRAAVQWYEFNVGTWPASGNPSLVQSGRLVGAAGVDQFMPAIYLNRLGDISLIYTASSASNITADTRVVGRKITDPLGTMSAPVRYATSVGGPYGGAGGENRWGDYLAIEVDPLDDVSFFGVSMTSENGSWLTNVHSWSISLIADAGVIFDALSANVYNAQGTYRSGNLASLTTTDANLYQIRSVPQTGVGQIASLETSYSVGTLPQDSVLKFNATISGQAGSTSMIYLYNWVTSAFEHVVSYPTNAGSIVRTVDFTASIAKYVGPSGEVRAITRMVVPIVRGRMPQPFTFRVNRLNVRVQ